MSDMLGLWEEEEIEAEVWKYFSHTQPKDFCSSPTPGLVRPTPVRPVTPSWAGRGDNVLTSRQQHSLFLSPFKRTGSNQDTTKSRSTTPEEMEELIKLLKVKDGVLKFQRLQRTRGAETEENLRAHMTTITSDMDTVLADLRESRLELFGLKLENEDQKTHIDELTAEVQTLGDQVSNLMLQLNINNWEGSRAKKGGGEGSRRKSPAERSEVAKAISSDSSESTGPTHVLLPCSIISPVKFEKSLPSYEDIGLYDKCPDLPTRVKPVLNEHKNGKTSRSIFDRIGAIFGRIKG